MRKAIDMIKRLADSEGKALKKQADAEASGELGEPVELPASPRCAALPPGPPVRAALPAPAAALTAGSSPSMRSPAYPALPAPPPADALTEEERLAKTAEFAEESGKYAKFWKNFGKSLKMGIIEDSSNRCAVV